MSKTDQTKAPQTEADKGPLVTKRWVAGWLTAMASMALVIAIWNAIHTIPGEDALSYLVAWPTLIKPTWVSIVVALIALGVISQIYARQVNRDQAKAEASKVWMCTECESAGWPGSAFTAKDHRDATGHLTASGGPETLAHQTTPGAQIVHSDYHQPGDR